MVVNTSSEAASSAARNWALRKQQQLERARFLKDQREQKISGNNVDAADALAEFISVRAAA